MDTLFPRPARVEVIAPPFPGGRPGQPPAAYAAVFLKKPYQTINQKKYRLLSHYSAPVCSLKPLKRLYIAPMCRFIKKNGSQPFDRKPSRRQAES